MIDQLILGNERLRLNFELGQLLCYRRVKPVRNHIDDDKLFFYLELEFLDTGTWKTRYLPHERDVYIDKTSGDEISWYLAGLAGKLTKRFPLVEVQVTDVRGKEVEIDIGPEAEIWPGAKYLILKEDDQIGPRALTMRRVDGQVVEARVMKWKQPESRPFLAVWRPFNREVLPTLRDAPIITK